MSLGASIAALVIVGVFAAIGPVRAQAIGGTGGTSGGGVAGGTSGRPGDFDPTISGRLGGGGGGGGGPGQSGGLGGFSGDGDAGGGPGGTPGSSGSQGTTLSPGGGTGGGGGGGGGGGVNGLETSGNLTVTVSPTLGAGGAGGAAGAGVSGTSQGDGAGGGGGGAGGYGVIDTGSGDVILVNAGVTVAGGSGGSGAAGGAGGSAVSTGNGGNGGNGGGGGGGGIGVYFANGGGTLINNGIVAGGPGGSGGLGGLGGVGGSGGAPGANGTQGAPGAGVQGAGLTIVNAGSIRGGGSAAAIHFTGGTNTLASSAGGSISGAIIDTGTLIFDQTGKVTASGINTNASVHYSSAINGLGSLFVRAGSNTVTLTGVNSYTGGTAISSGTLQIGGAGSLRTGSYAGAITDNGTFEYSSSVTQTLSGVISGSGPLIKDTSGSTLNLAGQNTYFGPTIVSAGELQALAANALSANSATTVNVGGELDLHGFDQTVSSLAGGGTVSNDRSALATLTNRGASSTFSGTFFEEVGKIGLIQESSGNTLTLDGNYTYSGPTTVQAGTLKAGAAKAFSPNSPTTIDTGATLDLGGFGQSIKSVFLSGGVIERGALQSVNGITSTGGTVDGIGGTTSLTVNSRVTTLNTTTGGNTYTGATTINGGTLLGGATNAFSPNTTVRINPAGTVDLGGLGQQINLINLAGGTIQNGTLSSLHGIVSTGGTLNSIVISTSGADANALSVAGSGSQVNLIGANSFTTQGAGAVGLNAFNGGVISATGATNVTTANPAAGAVALRGNGASIVSTGGGMIAAAGDAIEFLGGNNQTATFDNFNISTQSGAAVFADPANATINFNNSVVNAGTGYLLDATGGSIITLNASASTLNGAMRTDAISASNINLVNGTVWNLTGPSNVSKLALTNSIVVFAPPGTGGGFKTLTLNNYVGSGANIVLNTALGGSTSPTDQIIVSGGSATGSTSLAIKNAGGLGAQTTGTGIPIVTTTNGGSTASNAFALANTPVLNGYRYSLEDESGNWYLVSSPTTTQAQVQSSINAIANAQLSQIVNNGLLSSILLGATQQISCSNCASGFGAFGSFALGTQGRLGLSDRLTAIGGISYNQWSSSGISVYDAPTIAGALLYDFDNWGSSRPFIEAGGWLTPYESVHGARVYPNGLTTASGSWTSVDRDLSLFVRAGWLARLTPIDEAAAYADFGRNWLQTGGYTETTTAINAYPLSAAPELQALNIARLGAQYTHLFAGNIEVNVSGAVAHGFGGGTGGTVNVTDFGLFTASALPTTTWFEYGARVGYRFNDQMVLDAFVLGALGGEVHAAAHGGIALRVAF